MNIIFSHSASSITEVQEEWLRILGDANVNNVFLTPQFQAEWWKNYGCGECTILRLENAQKELIGLAPFFVDGNDVRFFGDAAVFDYLDFIVEKDKEEEFFALFIGELK